VEMQLFRIYARLTRCETAEVASAAFHSIIGFRIRLEVTHAAARSALVGSALSSWNALHNRTNTASKKRNSLAHFVVVYGINRPTVAEHGPFLEPSPFDVIRKSQPTDKPIDTVRIKIMGTSFRRVAERLRSFADSLPTPASSLGTPI
jgi:hypothetical protein